MKFADLSTSQLQALLKLVKEKEALLDRLNQIESLIREMEGGHEPKTPVKQARRRSRRRSRRVAIVQALEAAGEKGLTLRQIAEEIGRSYGSVRVWFSTKGKKLDGIVKLAPGIYRSAPAAN